MFEKIIEARAFVDEDRKALRELLGNPVLLSALREVHEEAQARTRSLVTIGLESDEGLARARGMQGEIRGMARAIDLIVELATEDGD